MPMSAIQLLFADDLLRSHGDPEVWWIGQIMKHVTRVQPRFKNEIENLKKQINFTSPIVG